MSEQKMLKLETFLASRVVRLAGKLSDAVATIYTGPYALTVPQWRVLATLAEQEGLTAASIAVQTSMDKVKVSRAIKHLMTRALVSRQLMRGDGRAYQLSLTSSGWQLYQRVVPDALAWQRSLLCDISDDDYHTFLNVMTRLEQQLTNKANNRDDS